MRPVILQTHENSASQLSDVLRGHGRVGVARVAGASALVAGAARAPLQLLVPRPRGPAVWACAGTLGGGLVDGDALALEVAVGDGAALLVSTQASTKVYRGAASQRLSATVGDGALLAL